MENKEKNNFKSRTIKISVIISLAVIVFMSFIIMFVNRYDTGKSNKEIEEIKRYLTNKYPEEEFENIAFEEKDDYYGNFSCNSNGMGQVGGNKGHYYLYKAYAKGVNEEIEIQKIVYNQDYMEEKELKEQEIIKDNYEMYKERLDFMDEVKSIAYEKLGYLPQVNIKKNEIEGGVNTNCEGKGGYLEAMLNADYIVELNEKDNQYATETFMNIVKEISKEMLEKRANYKNLDDIDIHFESSEYLSMQLSLGNVPMSLTVGIKKNSLEDEEMIKNIRKDNIEYIKTWINENFNYGKYKND